MSTEKCSACDKTGGPAKESLLHLYVEFISTKLIPELEALATKFAVWWSFKQDSTLKKFLGEQKYSLPQYFLPSDLKTVVENVLSNMTQEGNSNMIELDPELQQIFDHWIIYLPNIVEDCLLPHIIEVSPEISAQLKDEHMIKNCWVETPYEILFKDPTSVFWLHPICDFLINNSTGTVYSWPQLLNIFTDFCTNNKKFFTRHSDSIISVNENTPLTSLFGFQYFHTSQIENILKYITKFLGRRKGIFKSCSALKYSYMFHTIASTSKYNNVFTFIDDIINNNNAYLPYTGRYLYL